MHRLIFPLIAVALACCSSGQGSRAANPESEADSAMIKRPVFNADSAFGHIESQVGFGPRTPGSKAHKACEDYIVTALRAYGADSVTVQRTEVEAFDGKHLPIANIMASFNSKAPKRILLLAHYDTRPWADNDKDESKHSTPIDGANDGASGVAVLLEIARAIGTEAPGIGVDMLFTDAED